MKPIGATAIGWMIWRRNRIWVAIVGAYFLLVAIACHVMPRANSYDAICVMLLLPTIFAFIWILGEFTFGTEFDLANRESGFPSRMYTLPVPTWQLVGVPMAFGVMLAAGAWIFFSELLLRPRGADIPTVWPALFTAGLLAWIQALCWTAFPHAWLRVVVALSWLTGYIALVVTLQHRGLSDGWVAAVCAAQLPIAYLMAARGVAAARSGRSRMMWNLPTPALPSQWFRLRQLRSPRSAQTWFEWRGNGLSLPVMSTFASVAIVGLAWLTGSPHHPGPSPTLMFFLIFFPLFTSLTTAPTMARFQRNQKIQPMVGFMATRPLRTGDFVIAKFIAAARSVLTAYGIIAVAAVIMFTCTYAGHWTIELTREPLAALTRSEKAAILLTGMIGLPLFTWMGIINNLWIGLSGRRIGFVYMVTVMVILLVTIIAWSLLFQRIHVRENWPTILPWILGVAAAIKVSLAATSCGVALKRGAVQWPKIAVGATAWLGIAGVSMAVLLWMLAERSPYGTSIPGAVLLGLPSVGIALAPVALDWNRHGG